MECKHFEVGYFRDTFTWRCMRCGQEFIPKPDPTPEAMQKCSVTACAGDQTDVDCPLGIACPCGCHEWTQREGATRELTTEHVEQMLLDRWKEEREFRRELLTYLEKSATFMDFDLKTNGNAQRRSLIKDLRRRFL